MAESDERVVTDEELAHYGTPRHSGRYPWGSGDTPMQSGRDLSGTVSHLRRHGMTDPEIAKGLGFKSTTELRARMSISKEEKRAADSAQAVRLQQKGMSVSAIARQMGRNESSVRALINPALAERRSRLQNTANMLKEKVDGGEYLDVGKGTEAWLGITSTQLSTAVAMLKAKGYTVTNVQQPQQFGKGKTTVHVLAPPGTTYVDIKRNPERIRTVAAYTEDGGRTFADIKPPVSISASRIGVRHAEQGGGEADGVIYLRPGVPDISLGGVRYAQVRIAVDKQHYLKGMAMYKEDLPDGVDLLFNTSKHDTGNKLDALKTAESGEEPWTTLIRHQRTYTDSQGHERQSPINIVYEQGEWRTWRPSISSQILSKQSTALAKRQLDLALTSRINDFDEILSLTNPVVKRKLLLTFGDEVDAAAVHLKAAALPGQGSHVILPFEKMKENEIYAPNYRNGEVVALFRHPHGGIFEIPELRVNNRSPEPRSTIGRAEDAVGIHPSVARRLSGADFDGDAVLVIPNTRGSLKTSPPLTDLLNFDARASYPPYEGMKTIDGGIYREATKSVDYGKSAPRGAPKQMHMGDVSNLITDMTIKGAKPEEIARAVRHSMVVIDAEKHALNYRQSYIDNGIASLKEHYQGRGTTGRLAGASTIISRAGSELRIPERRPRPYRRGGPIEPSTGEKVYEPTGRMTIDRHGREVPRRIRTTKLAEAVDARTLVSKAGTPMEEIYAAHSNSLKALGNKARFEALRTGSMKYSPSANKTYATEVASLAAKLNLALKNAPLERQAQIIARTIMTAKQNDNPFMDDDERKKEKTRALQTARARVGAGKDQIFITSREWEAVQAGAISGTRLSQIINNADLDRIKELATPRTVRVMTPAKIAIAKARLASGYTQAEVAASIGVPVSTLNNALLSE